MKQEIDNKEYLTKANARSLKRSQNCQTPNNANEEKGKNIHHQ